MLLSYLFQNPIFFIAWFLAIIFGITVHEFSHALAGYLQGDQTAKLQGRLTFNPVAHLDLMGMILLLLAGFGWGKPVPYNPFNLKNKKYGPALISLAGPTANLISVVFAGVILRLLFTFSNLGEGNLLILFLFALVQINIVLMVFNLIPIPPLDGAEVLFVLLPNRMSNIRFTLERSGPFILLGIILLGQPILSRIFISVLNFVFGIIA